MKKFNAQKKFNRIVLIVVAVLFCAVSFLCVPLDFSFASSAETGDYETFHNTLLQMDALDEENDAKSNDAEVVSLSDEDEDDDENEIIEERLIVYSDSSLDSCGAILKAEYNGCHIYQYADAQSAETAYTYFSGLYCVESVSYDAIVHAQDFDEETTTATAYTTGTYKTWGASYVGYQEYCTTLSQNYSESDLPEVVIAVLDSGIYKDHSWFEGRILTEYAEDFVGSYEDWTGVTKTYDYQDLNGHGTHVSGTIVETTLSNVKILPLKVLNYKGSGKVWMITDAIQKVINLKNQGLNIVAMNMSVGIEGDTPSLTAAVNKAYNANILSVVAAGNGDKAGNGISTDDCSPANVDNALVVAALKECKSAAYGVIRATYSNYGATVDLSAPGSSIESASITGKTATTVKSGTSMATPHVTACVALIYSNPDYEDYTPAQVTALLTGKARNLVSAGRDDYYGYGLVYIAGIGMIISGNVTFSRTEKLCDTTFDLTLSYGETYGSGETSKIYYTTDESVTTVTQNDTLYTGVISISETTKVTALAFVYDTDGKVIKRSKISSFTYYFKDETGGYVDLASHYTYTYGLYGFSYYCTITNYSGSLKSLSVPKKLGGYTVTGVRSSAFKDCEVEAVYLPSTITSIGDSAFDRCTNLKEVSGGASSVTIGMKAFADCTSLEKLDFQDSITYIYDYAFKNCSSLTSLELPKVLSIGSYVFSKSGVETLLVGKNCTSFGQQGNWLAIKKENVGKIYGYASSVVETFASENDVDFVDLTLKFETDFNNRITVANNETFALAVTYCGYGVQSDVSFGGSSINPTTKNLGEYKTQNTYTFSNLSKGTYKLYVTLTDKYSTRLKSNTINIVVVDSSTKKVELTFDDGAYNVYVDNVQVQSGDTLYQGYEYEIKVEAQDGYDVKKISVNGTEQSLNEAITMTVGSQDVKLEVDAEEKSTLEVSFETKSKVVVKVDGVETESKFVNRNASISFSIEETSGHSVKSVFANGELLAVGDDGLYHIDNITKKVEVTFVFAEEYYTISVSVGKGGSCSTTGGSLETVAYGGSRTFTVSASDGYKLDSVSVNGKTVKVENNKFTLSDISEDCDVVISFERQTSTFGNDSVILFYFLVFLAFFVIFLISKLVLYFIRKERDRI